MSSRPRLHYAWVILGVTFRRWAVWIVAGASAVMIPIVALLMRDRPADVGLVPFGGTASDAAAATSKANPAAAALAALGDGARSRDFWLLFGTFFICGASTNGLVATHLIPAAHDHGIPEVRAAGLLALMGMFDLVGTTRYGLDWIAAGHQLGAAITAFSAGWIRTTLGDYQLAFWISGGLCIVAALLALAVGRRTISIVPQLQPSAFET